MDLIKYNVVKAFPLYFKTPRDNEQLHSHIFSA